MNRKSARRAGLVCALIVGSLALNGCSTVGSTTADLGFAGMGGVAGYHLSDGKVGGAAAGAAVGYLGSRFAQSQVQKAVTEAEQRGYERALNQSVKQQYWIIQNQQRAQDPSEATDARLMPIVIPETTINGVIQNARVEYLRVQ